MSAYQSSTYLALLTAFRIISLLTVHRRTSTSRSRHKETEKKNGGGEIGAIVSSAPGGGGGNHRRGTGRRGGGAGGGASSATTKPGARPSASSLAAKHANRDGHSGKSGPRAVSRPRYEIDGRARAAELYRRQLAQQEARGGPQPYRAQAPAVTAAYGRVAHAQDVTHVVRQAEGGRRAESSAGRAPSGPPRLSTLVEDLMAKPRPDEATLQFTTMRAVSVFRVCLWVGGVRQV